MRTPEQIIDDSILSQTNIKPSENEAVSLWHAIWILYDPSPAKHVMKHAMQEHAIEFAEWILKEGWRKYEGVNMYYNEPPTAGKQTYFSMKEVHQVYLKSIEPKTT